MVSEKPVVTWKTLVLPLIGVAAFLLYLYLLQTDIPEIVSTLQRANTLIYFLAGLLIFVDCFFYTMAWRSLLSFLSVKLSFFKSYLYVWYGTFMDIIIPAESVSGEISRIYLITREQGEGVSGKVVASLVVQRLISMGIGVATLGLGLGILIIETSVNSLVFNLSLFLISVTIFSLALLLMLCARKNWTLKVIDYVLSTVERLSRGKWKLTTVKNEVVKAAEMFHDSMKMFRRSPTVVIFSVILSTISWLCYLLISYMVFLAIGFSGGLRLWSVVLVTQSIVSAVRSIPIGIPFEVGLPEITMTTLYVVLGVPMGLSATATILERILTVWLRFFVGFLSQQWIEIKAVKARLKQF
ncbi:MAG: lysylphosphatidylglycerol synthase transmembrane domain-containing protein [Candidatus Bathyarchaeia archaeon]